MYRVIILLLLTACNSVNSKIKRSQPAINKSVSCVYTVFDNYVYTDCGGEKTATKVSKKDLPKFLPGF